MASAAGVTGASRIRAKGSVSFSPWKSFLKTITMRSNPTMYGGPPRTVRIMMKGFGWLLVAQFPAWLINKYAGREQLAAYFSNGDPRWDHCASVASYNLKARSLVWDPLYVIGTNPWTTYAPCYNKIPWGEVTQHDDPDEQKGWDAFGDGMGGARLRGMRQEVQQQLSFYHLFQAQEEYKSFASFYPALVTKSFKMWIEDLYYSYYHVFFNVPIDERYESLGQAHGRRLTSRWWLGCGWAGWRGTQLYDGALAPIMASTMA